MVNVSTNTLTAASAVLTCSEQTSPVRMTTTMALPGTYFPKCPIE